MSHRTPLVLFITMSWLGICANSAIAQKIGVGILSMGIESQLSFENSKEFHLNELNSLKVYSLASHSEVGLFDNDQSELRRFREAYPNVAMSDPLMGMWNAANHPSITLGLSTAVGKYVKMALTKTSTQLRRLDLAIETWSGAVSVGVLKAQLQGYGEQVQLVPINPGLEYFGLGSKLDRKEFFELKSRLEQSLLSDEDQRMIDSYRQILIEANVKVVNIAQDLNEDRIYRELLKRVGYVSSSDVRELARLYVRRAQRLFEELATSQQVLFVVNTGRSILSADIKSLPETDLVKRQDGWFRGNQENVLITGCYDSENGQIQKARGYFTSNNTRVCAPITASIKYSHQRIWQLLYEFRTRNCSDLKQRTESINDRLNLTFTLSAVANSSIANRIALLVIEHPEMVPFQIKMDFLDKSTQACRDLADISRDGRYLSCQTEYELKEETRQVQKFNSPREVESASFSLFPDYQNSRE